MGLRRGIYLSSLAAVLSILMLPAWATAGPPGPGRLPPPAVVVQPALMKDVNPPQKYVGHVEAIQTVEIQPRVSGYLVKVNFKEGAYVREGDLLYVIEQGPYQAEVEADMAKIAEARAELYRASRRLARLRAARPESIPATEIDDAIASERMAKAKLKEAQAQLELAKINLGYTTIRAPITGLLGKTFFTKGNLVGPEKGPLARLVQIEPIRVVYSISERDLISLQRVLGRAPQNEDHPLLEVRIRLPNGELYPETGRVDFVNNEVDPSTGTIAVYALFQNRDHLLRPGEYVDVLVSQERAQKMVVIPQKAVMTDLEGHYVLVVGKGDRVVQKRLRLGPQVGTEWVVESGLNPGDRVIVEGVQKVRPGQVVKAIIQKGE